MSLVQIPTDLQEPMTKNIISDSFSIEPIIKGVVRTDVGASEILQREIRPITYNTQITMRIFMTPEEFDSFKVWYRNDLNNGSVAFYWGLNVNMLYTETRFINAYNSSLNGNYYFVSTVVETIEVDNGSST